MYDHIPGILIRASSSSIDVAVFRNGPFSFASGVSACPNNRKLSENPSGVGKLPVAKITFDLSDEAN